MISKKIIDINNRYYIKITYNNDITRLYMLIEKDNDKTIVESFNRDSFLLKVNKYIKLTNKIECLVASV